jgi:hypothetical protein
MKSILLFLGLLYSGLLFSQNTADGFFINPAGIQSAPSLFGPADVHVFECGADIIFDGSNSMGEDGYFVGVSEFDLASWTFTNRLFADWVCAPCTAPNNIDVLSYFGGESPQCGEIYIFSLATRPTWATIDLFFTIDCGNNGVPEVKTFDITHRIQEDTLADMLDAGLAGIINQNGDYVSIGFATEESNNQLALATTHYDLTGTVTSIPQMGVLPDVMTWGTIGAEEIVNGLANDGYMVLLEDDNGGDIPLARLDPTGAVSWVDRVELKINGTTYPVAPTDFLIDGDRAVITGDLVFGMATQPFILVYDYVTRSVICSQVFQLNPGVATYNSAHVIVNNTNNSHYAIAGRTTNDLFYMELEYDCTFLGNTAHFYPLDGLSTTSPVVQEVLYDSNDGRPIICGNLDGGGADRLFIQNGINTILLTPPPGKEAELNAALFNQQDELILAGQIHSGSGDQKGFIMAIDHYAYHLGNRPLLWAKEYADVQYPETNILDIELAADGGYFTVGIGIQENTATGFSSLNFLDTWIMKTDEDGVLQNCNCYKEVIWTDQLLGGAGDYPVVEFSTDNAITNSPHSTVPLQDAAYYCDQWCPPPPDDCQVEATATKTTNPEDLCCYDLSFFIDPVHVDEFTQLEIHSLPGVALMPLISLDPQYSLIMNTSSTISLVSNTGNLCNGLDRFFPTGTLPSVELCVTDFNGNMPMIAVDFVKCDGEVCSDTLTLECSPCLEIVNDSLYCDGGDLKYVFDFQNTWDRPIKRLVVNDFAPAGAVFTPDTLFFPAGIPVGGVAGANTICVSNVSAPDSLKFDFKALDDDECCFCISNEVYKPIPICCDTCESIEYIVTDTIINGEECCYSLDVYHCTDSLFTALRLTTSNGVTLSQQSSGPSWSMYNLAQSSNTQQTWFPRPTPIHATNIPIGWSRNEVTFCLANYDGAPLPQVVQLEWLAGNDQNIVCTDSLYFDCELPPSDSTCALVTDTTWTCNPDGSYGLDLTVEVRWPLTAFQIYIDSLNSSSPGATFNPDPLVFSGMFPTGTLVAMPTLNVSDVLPGDTICFDLALSDTLVFEEYVNKCCHVEVCLVVPPCPGMGCEDLGIPVYDHDRMGWAAATCLSFTGSGYVMGLIDVRNNNSAVRGTNWPAPMQHYPAFTADTLGQIFGLAVDESACIYVTASSVYGNIGSGIAGPGGVYKLCPDGTGDYHLSNTATLPNGGSGLGQVTYDPVHQQIFVSNFHDGKIYRLDANTLATLSSYDFPGYATTPVISGSDFVALGERVWAVEYNPFDGKLYFSVWGEDQRNMGVVATNQLWSIAIVGGDFSAAANYVLDLPGRDYGGTNSSQNTMPISDLAFSKAGRMLVTERTMVRDNSSGAHDGRTFSYERTGTSWANPRLHHIGYTFGNGEHSNTSGGVDFGYLDNLEGCDSMVWNTGDALQFQSPLTIYGLQGHEWPGNSNVSSDPDYVGTNSIFIDLDGSTGTQAKTQYGDVEIFRDPCCGEMIVLEPDNCTQWETDVRNQGFTIQQVGTSNTIQIMPPPAMNATDWWVQNVNCNQSAGNQNRYAGDQNNNLGTNGNYLVCIDAYRVLEGDTCHVSFVYDGSIVIEPADVCISNEAFDELASASLKIRYLGRRVIIAAPGLSNNTIVVANFGDDTDTVELTREQLPYTHTYTRSGNFQTEARVVEYDDEGIMCNMFRPVATANPEASAIGLKLYPNPTQGNFQLDFNLPQAGEFTVAVFDFTGRKVLTQQHRFNAGQQQLTLEAGKLPPGTYLLRMVGSGFVAAAKFQRVR